MSLQAKLVRTSTNEFGIFGICKVNGLTLRTLEHKFDTGPKLTPGLHKCVRGTHKLEHGDPFETFEITGVPGHSGILFHVGNFNADSNGCVLVGMAATAAGLVQSRIAFKALMDSLVGINEFTLEVV